MPIDGLSEELSSEKALQDFSDIDSLAKSFIDTQKKLGTMVTLPGEDAPDEAVSKFFNKLGKPESVDGYEIDDTGLGMDEAALKSLKGAMHSLNMTKSQARGLVNFMSATTKEKLEAIQARDAEASEQTATVLKTEWGAEYEKRKGAAEKAMEEFFGEAKDDIAKLAAIKPAISKALASIGLSMSENDAGSDNSNSDLGGMTQESALQEIAKAKQDPEGPYRKASHPEHQEAVAHVTELYKIAYPGSG